LLQKGVSLPLLLELLHALVVLMELLLDALSESLKLIEGCLLLMLGGAKFAFGLLFGVFHGVGAIFFPLL